MPKRSGFKSSIQEFLTISNDEILGELTKFQEGSVETTQRDAWQDQIDLLEKVSGKLNFICGSADDLIPLKDRLEIKKRFKKLDPLEERFSYVEIEGADHGFMCDERESFDKAASLIGWNLLMKELIKK